MSRLRRIERVGRYFFITSNLLRATAPLAPEERTLCLERLQKCRARFSFALFAYVVMPDHVHLLLSTFASHLPAIMMDWKSRVAVAIGKLRGRKGPIWQPRYYDYILRRAGDLSSRLLYIHENPVNANLAAQPEDWPWSSAAHYINGGAVPLPPDKLEIPLNPNEPLWPYPGSFM